MASSGSRVRRDNKQQQRKSTQRSIAQHKSRHEEGCSPNTCSELRCLPLAKNTTEDEGDAHSIPRWPWLQRWAPCQPLWRSLSPPLLSHRTPTRSMLIMIDAIKGAAGLPSAAFDHDSTAKSIIRSIHAARVGKRASFI